MHSITLPKPDDWHLHLREGDSLADTIKASSSTFARALVMPNLVPPLTTTEQVVRYEQDILNLSQGFKPYFSLYLTDKTNETTLTEAANSNSILGLKLYPQGATTNSSFGVTDLKALYPVFELMQSLELVLQIHGETTQGDVFHREANFITESLTPITHAFPNLKIVLEHVSTKAGVEFVQSASKNVAATITIHHLLFNRNHLLSGGIKPHYYCLPILKSETNQKALQKAAISGSPKFFLGTDSAPHAIHKKEAACGCAGIFSAPYALQLYTDFFYQMGRLEKLPPFASEFGADFYRLSRNLETITLEKRTTTAKKEFSLGKESIIPINAGLALNWSLANEQ